MQRLGQADLERVISFLGEAAALETEETFPPELLAALRRLIPCDHVNFSQLDRIRRKTLGFTMFPACDVEEEDEGQDDDEPHWRLHDEHPVCHYQDVTRDFRAYRLSDVIGEREWRERELYVDWYGPDGLEYQMCVGLDAPLSHTKVFVFNRQGGRDFSERDRAVANLLRPHLTQLYDSAQTRRRFRQALALHEHTHAAVVLLDGEDRIAFASPAAQELLKRWFGETGSVLPEQFRSRRHDGRTGLAHDPIKIVGEEQAIVVHRVENAFLLEEKWNLPAVTRREQEILDLVAEGRTNAEIAAALWLAPGTVRRHLENVFRKLGVHTRTAAVARLRLPVVMSDGDE
jgi:DNA-binding CsgD family transcriptional regulator